MRDSFLPTEDLRGTALTNANLTNANLSGAKWTDGRICAQG
jgi:uncharacterized protein YjbI with pentapeptide repeats